MHIQVLNHSSRQIDEYYREGGADLIVCDAPILRALLGLVRKHVELGIMGGNIPTSGEGADIITISLTLPETETADIQVHVHYVSDELPVASPHLSYYNKYEMETANESQVSVR